LIRRSAARRRRARDRRAAALCGGARVSRLSALRLRLLAAL